MRMMEERMESIITRWAGPAIIIDYQPGEGKGRDYKHHHYDGVTILPFRPESRYVCMYVHTPYSYGLDCDDRRTYLPTYLPTYLLTYQPIRLHRPTEEGASTTNIIITPIKAMMNMGLDAVQTRFALPIDPAITGMYVCMYVCMYGVGND